MRNWQTPPPSLPGRDFARQRFCPAGVLPGGLTAGWKWVDLGRRDRQDAETAAGNAMAGVCRGRMHCFVVRGYVLHGTTQQGGAVSAGVCWTAEYSACRSMLRATCCRVLWAGAPTREGVAAEQQQRSSSSVEALLSNQHECAVYVQTSLLPVFVLARTADAVWGSFHAWCVGVKVGERRHPQQQGVRRWLDSA